MVIVNRPIQPSCEDSNAVFESIANEGYLFLRGNDGNTSNPRMVTMTSDTTFIASFESIQGIEGVAVGRMLVCRLSVPTSGVYVVKIGDCPARRVVVVK